VVTKFEQNGVRYSIQIRPQSLRESLMETEILPDPTIMAPFEHRRKRNRERQRVKRAA
jgi:hypothetical protein